MSKAVAVVTGAARGIGAAIAQQLATDGMDIAIIDLDEEACRPVVAEIESAGGRAIGVAADVANEQAVAAAIDRVVAELGVPTVLVNNAGITRDNMLFKMPVQDWDTVIAVHLRGPFLLAKAVQKYMVDAGWGRIVNLSSISAVGNRGQANYSAAKAGIQGFTKTLALELGQFGITVNAIAPGFIESEMTIATAQRLGMAFDDLKAEAIKEIAMRRVGEPSDIAHVASFLVSEGASYVSGQTLYVTGGPI